MYKQGHDEAQHVGQELHALVIGQLERLVDFGDDVGEAVAQILIMHELEQVAFLLDSDRLRVEKATYLILEQPLIAHPSIIVINDIEPIIHFLLSVGRRRRVLVRHVKYLKDLRLNVL